VVDRRRRTEAGRLAEHAPELDQHFAEEAQQAAELEPLAVHCAAQTGQGVVETQLAVASGSVVGDVLAGRDQGAVVLMEQAGVEVDVATARETNQLEYTQRIEAGYLAGVEAGGVFRRGAQRGGDIVGVVERPASAEAEPVRLVGG